MNRPCSPYELGARDVHVWRASLDLDPTAMLPDLSDDELARAGAYHFSKDRKRFVVGRGILRRLLAGYLGDKPRELQFDYGPQGKPALAGIYRDAGVSFNLSHAADAALYAVTRERAIGIDIEQIRPGFAGDGIAERFFSAAERRSMASLPPGAKDAAFFACWTRKEAYIKATGQGLSLPLDQFTVSLTPHEPARLSSVDWDPAQINRWSLYDLPCGAEHMAALAVEGRGLRLVFAHAAPWLENKGGCSFAA